MRIFSCADLKEINNKVVNVFKGGELAYTAPFIHLFELLKSNNENHINRDIKYLWTDWRKNLEGGDASQLGDLFYVGRACTGKYIADNLSVYNIKSATVYLADDKEDTYIMKLVFFR